MYVVMNSPDHSNSTCVVYCGHKKVCDYSSVISQSHFLKSLSPQLEGDNFAIVSNTIVHNCSFAILILIDGHNC
jgi:hypothetical protein